MSKIKISYFIFTFISLIFFMNVITPTNAYYVVNANETKSFLTTYSDYENDTTYNYYSFYNNYYIDNQIIENSSLYIPEQNRNFTILQYNQLFNYANQNTTLNEISTTNNQIAFTILLKQPFILFLSENSFIYIDYAIQQFQNESGINHITNYNYNQNQIIYFNIIYSTTQFIFNFNDGVNTYSEISVFDYTSFAIKLSHLYNATFLSINAKYVNNVEQFNFNITDNKMMYRIRDNIISEKTFYNDLSYQQGISTSNYVDLVEYNYKKDINELYDNTIIQNSSLNEKRLLMQQNITKFTNNVGIGFTSRMWLYNTHSYVNYSTTIYDFSFKTLPIDTVFEVGMNQFGVNSFKICLYNSNNTIVVKYLSSPETYLFSDYTNLSLENHVRIGFIIMPASVNKFYHGIYYYNYETNQEFYWLDLTQIGIPISIFGSNHLQLFDLDYVNFYYSENISFNLYDTTLNKYTGYQLKRTNHFDSYQSYLTYSKNTLSEIMNDSTYDNYIKTSEKIQYMNFTSILVHNSKYFNEKNTTLITNVNYRNITFSQQNNATYIFDMQSSNAVNVEIRNLIRVNYTTTNNDYRYQIDTFDDVKIYTNIDISFKMLFQKRDLDLFEAILSIIDVILIFFITIYVFARYKNKYLVLLGLVVSSGLLFLIQKVDIYLFIIIEILNIFICAYLYNKYDKNDSID